MGDPRKHPHQSSYSERISYKTHARGGKMGRETAREHERNMTAQEPSEVKNIKQWKWVMEKGGRLIGVWKNRAKSKETVHCDDKEEKGKNTSNNPLQVGHLGRDT